MNHRVTPTDKLSAYEMLIDIVEGDARALQIGVIIGKHINRRTGQCNPSIGRIARLAGCSTSSVKRAVKFLEKKGWLSVRRTRGGSRSDANSYQVTGCSIGPGSQTTPVTDEPGSSLNPVHIPPSDGVHQCTPNPIRVEPESDAAAPGRVGKNISLVLAQEMKKALGGDGR